jgi:hypothetical protein
MWGIYDDQVTSSARPDPKNLLPGGIFDLRRSVRRRGALMGVAVAAGLFVASALVGWLTDGVIGGALSFVLLVMAIPVMPVLGMPVAGGSGRFMAAVAASGAIWLIIGHLVASRVARQPVVGWREWSREFVVMGAGLWIGALAGLGIAAVALGAL